MGQPDYDAELSAYEATFDDEPPVEEKLAALDLLARPGTPSQFAEAMLLIGLAGLAFLAVWLATRLL